MSHAREVTGAKRMKVRHIYAEGMCEQELGRPGFRIGRGRVFGNPNASGEVGRAETYGFAVCCLRLSRLKPVPQDRGDSVGPALAGNLVWQITRGSLVPTLTSQAGQSPLCCLRHCPGTAERSRARGHW